MDRKDMITHCSGFDLKVEKTITNKDIVTLCESLELLFGEGYKSIPERISEGGIIMKDWPGKEDRQYKTMRIYFNHKEKYFKRMEKWRNI